MCPSVCIGLRLPCSGSPPPWRSVPSIKSRKTLSSENSHRRLLRSDPLSVSPSVCAVRRLPHSSPLLPGLALLARAAWLAVVSAKPQTRNEAGAVSRWLLGRPEAAQGLGAGEAAESEEMLAGPAQGSVSLHGRDPCPQLSVSGLPGVTPTLPLSGLEIASPP